MIVQNSNPVSLLTNTENSGTSQESGQVSSGNSGAFNTSLIQQIGLLQGATTKNELSNLNGKNAANASMDSNYLLSLLSSNGLTANDVPAGNVQNFAALLGKDSPTASQTNQANQGINLEDTLKTLSEVMQYLQGMKSETSAVTANPALNVTTSQSTQPKSSDAKVISQSGQQPDMAVLSDTITALSQQSLAAQQPDVQTQNSDQLPLLTQSLPVNPSLQKKPVNSKDQQPQQTVDPLAAALAAATIQPAQPQTLANVAIKTPLQVSSSANQEQTQSADSLQSVNNIQTQSQTVEVAASTSPVGAESTANQSTFSEEIAKAGIKLNQGASSADTTQINTMPVSAAALNDATITSQSTNSPSTEQNANTILNNLSTLNQAVSSGTTAQAPAMTMTQNLTHPEWNNELGQKLIWMHTQNIPSAEIKINPPDLGPLSIKIDVDQNQQTTVSFITQHSEVKDAIEAAIPKLREMLNGQQLSLLDVNVSQQQTDQRQTSSFFQAANQQGQGNQSGQNAQSGSDNNLSISSDDDIESGQAVVSNGLLSVFA
jgi:flagellar hook-length control protein FliK